MAEHSALNLLRSCVPSRFVRQLYLIEGDEEEKQGKPRTNKWTHENLFRVHAIIIFIATALCENFKPAMEFLLTKSKIIRCSLHFLLRYCHHPVPELETPLEEPIGNPQFPDRQSRGV